MPERAGGFGQRLHVGSGLEAELAPDVAVGIARQQRHVQGRHRIGAGRAGRRCNLPAGSGEHTEVILEEVTEAVGVSGRDAITRCGEAHGLDEGEGRRLVDVGCLARAEPAGIGEPDGRIDVPRIVGVETCEDLCDTRLQRRRGGEHGGRGQRNRQQQDAEIGVAADLGAGDLGGAADAFAEATFELAEPGRADTGAAAEVLVAQEQLAPRLAAWLSEGISERWMMLMLVNVFLFLISAVMDEIAVMVILGPLMIALAQKFGIDPIHFGSIIVTNVAIGMAAPPIGYCLFVGMAISGLSLGAVSRAIWPMVLAMLVVLMLTTYVPAFSLWLPGLVYRP